MQIGDLALLQAADHQRKAIALLNTFQDEARGERANLKATRGDGWNLGRVLMALAEGASLARAAPVEYEQSERIAARLGRAPTPGTVFCPTSQTRDLTAASAGAGGYLVGTANAPGDIFADGLRAASATLALGVPEIDMGQGNATVPRISTDASSYWLSTEATAITESQPTFGQVALTQKTVGVYGEASRSFLLGASPAAQAFLLRSFAAVTAAAVDTAVIQGVGAAGQPLGLVNSGITTASGASITLAKTLQTVADVEAAGVRTPSALGWAVAPGAAQILRAKEKATGSGFIMNGSTVDGTRAAVSTSVPALTAIFGDWSQIIIGTWGVLELGADPFGANSSLFNKGLVGLRAIWTVDVGILQAAAFSKLTSIS